MSDPGPHGPLVLYFKDWNLHVHFQAICDSNTTMTPRVNTPAETKSRRNNAGLNLNHRLSDEFPNLSTRHQQPPSSILVDSDSDDDTAVNNNTRPRYTIGANSHRVRKPSTSSFGKNKDTSSSAVSPTASVNSMLRKYGVEGQERGDYYSRSGSQQSRASDKDSWLQPSDSMPKKRTGSDVRTRDTLNSLLNNTEGRSSHDLLGNIGVPKTRKNDSNSTRQKASVVPATRSKFKFEPFNTFLHTRNLQQTTLNIFCQKMENLYY